MSNNGVADGVAAVIAGDAIVVVILEAAHTDHAQRVVKIIQVKTKLPV